MRREGNETKAVFQEEDREHCAHTNESLPKRAGGCEPGAYENQPQHDSYENGRTRGVARDLSTTRRRTAVAHDEGLRVQGSRRPQTNPVRGQAECEAPEGGRA